jgi:8-oxo-dGTP pyrophosphatase MutT (NUDIX family)
MNRDELHLSTGLIRVGGYSVIVESDHVLLVLFDDETGPHYNFPGGGHDPGETIVETVRRETREETTLEVDVGKLLAVTEYAPFKMNEKYGPYHKLGLFFEATPLPGQRPRIPDVPDPNEVGVEWVPLAGDAPHPVLPDIRSDIVRGVQTGGTSFRQIAR